MATLIWVGRDGVRLIIHLLTVDERLCWRGIGIAAEGKTFGRSGLIRSRVRTTARVAPTRTETIAAFRSAGAVAGRRPVDAGLTGSRRRLLWLALRLWLRWLSLCLRLLSHAADATRRCGLGRLARLCCPASASAIRVWRTSGYTVASIALRSPSTGRKA